MVDVRRKDCALRHAAVDDAFPGCCRHILTGCCSPPQVACQPTDYVRVELAVTEFVQESSRVVDAIESLGVNYYGYCA